MWTYAAAFSEVETLNEPAFTHQCPCASSPGAPAHPFIGDHYYYESGFAGTEFTLAVFYISDPLWLGWQWMC